MKIGKKVRNKGKSSIALEEMRLSVPEQNNFKAGIFYFSLIMLGLISSLGCFYSSFSIPVAMPVLILFTVLFGAVFTSIFLMKRKNTWFVIGALSAVTLIILIFKKTFYYGMLVTVKYILGEFRAHGSGIAFPSSLNAQLNGTAVKTESTFFIVCLTYILTIAISWLMIKKRNFFLAGFITIPFVFAPLLVPITPHFIYIVLLLLYYFTLIFLSPSLSGSKMFRRGLRGYHISSNSSANPVAFSILPLFLVCIIIVSIFFPQSSFKRSPFLEAVRTSVLNGFSSTDFSRYMNAAFGGDLSNIDLKSVGNISFNNLPVIGLTMNGDYYYTDSLHVIGENHTEYLKGYAGSVYSDEGWGDLTAEQSQEIFDIFGSASHAQNIYGDFKTKFRYGTESRDYFDMSVKYIRGDPRRVYIPYGLSGISNKSELKYIGDSYMVATNSDMGIDNYSYTAFSVFDDNENISLTKRLKILSLNYESDEHRHDLPYKTYTAEDGETYSGYGYFGIDDNGYIYFSSTQGYFEGIEKYDPSKDYGDLFKVYDETDDGSVSYDEAAYGRLSKYLTNAQLDYIDTLNRYDGFTKRAYTQVPDNISYKLDGFIRDNDIRTDNMNNTVFGDLFGEYDETDDGSVSYDEAYDRLSKYLTNAQLDYIDTLNRYDGFTKRAYTQVPDNIGYKLDGFIRDNGIRTDNMNNTIFDVINVLKNSGNYKYTLSPGRTPDDKDFAEYFLFENKKGYCRHFATAATLLLREAGIPARYAEGYKFDSTRFTNTNYIELLDSNAHAWVEVYYSGTGWVPVEVTPGEGQSGFMSETESGSESSYEESNSGSNSEISDESSMESGTESSGQHTSETSSEASDITETNNGSNVAPIVYIMSVPVCCAVIFGVLALNRFIRVRKRRNSFTGRNANRSALAIYEYIVRLLLYRTTSSGSKSDCEKIEELAESEKVSQSRRKWCAYFCSDIYPIAEKAKFSGRAITQAELKTLSESADKIRSNIMSELNIFRKFAAVYFDLI